MNVVIKVNDEVKNKMIEYYKDKKRDKVIPYVVFQADDEDTVITMYESGKVMFQGVSADVDASMWGVELEKKEKAKEDSVYLNTSAVGSDEVGTGDYFGPIVVTASFVFKSQVKELQEMGILDSKKMTDENILKVAPRLSKMIKYRSIILTNSEYNLKYSKDVNMNKIKSIMHNKVLWQLIHEENPQYDYIIIDEFVKEKSYYNYLNGISNIQRNITFMTKAEDKNLAVAASSVISRYIFLKEFDKLSDSLGIPLPKGSGATVDTIGEEIVEKFGSDKLNEIAKLNFRNTQRILHTLIY